MAETEDVPYNVDEFATPDKPTSADDVDQPNKSVLLEVRKYLDEAIKENNTFDVIDLTESGKMTPTQQIAVFKLVTKHLRDVKEIIDNKIKELK